MNKNLQMGLFLTIFLIVFFGLHYFVITNYFEYFSLTQGFLKYFIILFLTLSYPISMMLEKNFAGKFARTFYYFASIWIGFLFISFTIILIIKIIGLIFIFKYAGEIVLTSSILISIYSIFNANNIIIKKIEIPFKEIKKKMRIVQLSDIHLGSINREKYLSKIVEKTNKQNPDLVVISGDLVDGSAPINEHMVDGINKIKSDVLYVIGNHEIYEGLKNIMPILNKTKMKILRNDEFKFRGITFLGLDYIEGNKEINKKIVDYKYDKPAILIYHAPSIKADLLSKIGIKLHLSGHTHGGQIFPFNLLVKLAFPYVKGLHKSKDGKSYVYVSEGSGTWGPPMRLFTKCELTVINLNPIKD